jgi:hypothetical protein
MRVVHRACAVGVAPAREAKSLAVGLAHDGAAGIEHPRCHGGIDLGHVAVQDAGAVHHGHAGQHDVVLQNDLLTREGPGSGAGHDASVVPGVARILLGWRPMPGWARVALRGRGVLQRVDEVVGSQPGLHEADVRPGLLVVQREAELPADPLDLVTSGSA